MTKRDAYKLKVGTTLKIKDSDTTVEVLDVLGHIADPYIKIRAIDKEKRIWILYHDSIKKFDTQQVKNSLVHPKHFLKSTKAGSV